MSAATRIIAYTFTASICCPECTADAAAVGFLTRLPPLSLGTDEHGLALDLVDRDGNPVHPVFMSDEVPDGLLVCDECGNAII